jgi:nitrogen regulatory protein PII
VTRKDQVNKAKTKRNNGNSQWKTTRADVLPKTKVEIIEDKDVKQVIDTIVKTACTDLIGDGEIFVSTVDDAIRIKAGKRGIDFSARYLNCAATFLLLS